MLWPFVSRETLDEAKASRERIIERLERDILELKEDRKVTVDILSVRALGVPIYGKIKPPQEEEPEPETEAKIGEDGEIKHLPAMMPGRARAIAQSRSATNLEQYVKDQAEMVRLVEQAKEEGRLAAEAPTNGNDHHS